MTSKEIYEAIDQSKIGDKGKNFLKKAEEKTKGFTVENEQLNKAMNKIYNDLKEKKPEALKNLKTKKVEKTVKVPTTKSERKKDPKKKTKKVKKKVEKANGKKKNVKPTPTPSTPKEKEVPFTKRASEYAKKHGITYKEAMKKLSEKIKRDEEKKTKEATKELDSLLKFVRSKDFEDGEKYPKTYGKQKAEKASLSSDAKRKAKPVGKRKSKSGKTYYEYRDNRYDRNSVPAPKGEYKYKGKTPPFLELGGVTTDLSADSLDAITYAKGGELSTHGLKVGDVIGKEIKYDNGEVNLVVKDKSGKKLFVDLEDGYRDEMPPLPFKKGGRVVKVVNEGEEFDEEKYQAIFGDYDKDGVANINDVSPLDKSKMGKVEQIELDQTFKKLIDLKNNLDDKMYKALDKLDKKAPKNAEFYARTKTPFSIVKKLVDKRLLDPKKGLTDMIGTTVVVSDHKELEKVKNDIQKGLMGEVLDFDDFYKFPNNGYRAYHFIVEFEGMPVEIQLKTKRQKQLNEVSHEFYKKGNLNAKALDEVSKMIMKADKGDKKALAEVNKLLKDKKGLAKKISTNKMAKGGALATHGLKQGDTIIETVDGNIQMVKDKNGKIMFVNLADGYRDVDEPLPFAKGGRLKSALMRDRKYFSKDESWERAYNKGKNRKGYMADGGEIDSFVVIYKIKEDLDNKKIEPTSVAYKSFEDAEKFKSSIEKDGGKAMIANKKMSFDKGGEIDAFIMRSIKGVPNTNLKMDAQELKAKLEKGGKLSEKASYISPTEIYSIKLKDGREFENHYSDMQFLSGAYVSDKPVTEDEVDESQLSLFKKGGKLPKDAIYINRRDIESIKYDDVDVETIDGKFLYNGFWIDPKKDKKLIAEAKEQGRLEKGGRIGFKEQSIIK